MGYEDELRKEAERKQGETQRLSQSPEALDPIPKKETQEQPTTKTQLKSSIAKKLSCCSCLGGIIPILLFLVISTAVVSFFVEKTFFLDADPSNFHPTASYAEMKEFAGEQAIFYSMEATNVPSSGIINLYDANKPEATYTFLEKTGGQDNYRKIEITAYRPWQMHHVSGENSLATYEYDYINFGKEKEISRPTVIENVENLSPPSCSFIQLWQTAIQEGTAPDSIAHITYSKNGYTFNVPAGPMLQFDFNCELINN